jgi:methylated-DNA-[protein]-cysteine S-methyltransferase
MHSRTNPFERRIRESQALTDFQKNVLLETIKVPKGTVITYKELARRIGKPKAYRAVGNALRANPFAPDVPCHRIVRSDNRTGGYSGREDSRKKAKLLRAEGFKGFAAKD